MTNRIVEPVWLDAENPDSIERYVVARGLVQPSGLPVEIGRAGAGNMNLAMRVTPTTGDAFIVKQGRPWVEKYKQIPAPAERTLVEAAFYAAVQTDRRIARRMPKVIDLDSANHVLVLEDVGSAGDFTSIYGDGAISASVVRALLEWLEHLATVSIAGTERAVFANRAMRALNHEHMFDLPLRERNGLDLDAITPGLSDAARDLIADREYGQVVGDLGRRYLADGTSLVHGDYFPGSWLKCADGVRIIDPEFCFLGDPEFDCGILAAHLTIAASNPSTLEMIAGSAENRRLDLHRVAQYAGVEIMRRLIGVAQLPIQHDIHRKRALLERSRRLVNEPQRGLV
jgi:5-methylthioribose kinase